MQYGKDRLTELLLSIDEEASLLLNADGRRYPVVIVGGSALLLHDLTSRPATHDIDVLSCHTALRDVLSKYAAVNGAVAAYADQIPFNFEDRLVKLDIPTRIVDFMTPSAEDLAVMKLYSCRPNDIEDLESPAMLAAIDWDVMDRLVYGKDEAAASALSRRRYDEMASAYEKFARRHGHAPDV